ncbi:MAG TPA: hypothetical protein VL463_10345, partial [Kofleriaceae bacterium]|nr:hypothetical protein [Kofleriaceae bacterium]
LAVDGSLSDLAVNRAIQRVSGELRACYLRTAKSPQRATARARFEIDESRRAIAIHADGPLASCVSDALRGVRTETPPDVGTEKVSFTIIFEGVR